MIPKPNPGPNSGPNPGPLPGPLPGQNPETITDLATAVPSAPWRLYLIRCANNNLYAGITTDLDRRLAEHQAQGPQCAKYLKGKAPLALVFVAPAGQNRSEASRLEYFVKRLSKRQKEQLVAGNTSLELLGLSPRPQASESASRE